MSAKRVEIAMRGSDKKRRTRERGKGSDSPDYDGQWMQPSLQYAPLSLCTTILALSSSLGKARHPLSMSISKRVFVSVARISINRDI